MGLSEGISNYAEREIQVLWILFVYLFCYTTLVFHHLMNGMILNVQTHVWVFIFYEALHLSCEQIQCVVPINPTLNSPVL